MVGAIKGSTQREPIVVGKPAYFMLDNIAKQFGLHKNQICMVGDRLDTDILFGQNGGLTTALVLSGTWATACRHALRTAGQGGEWGNMTAGVACCESRATRGGVQQCSAVAAVRGACWCCGWRVGSLVRCPKHPLVHRVPCAGINGWRGSALQQVLLPTSIC
jgi:hypothetical protein